MKIFVASMGRCGTRFMAEVFKALTDIPSFHELWPKCINVMSEDINNHKDMTSPLTRKLLDMKIDEIKRRTKNGNYFEANHMFIKTFVSTVVKAFPDDVYCIYVQRNLFDVLKSYSQRGKRHRFPLDFQLNPKWRGNKARLSARYSFFEMVAWNYFEVKERFNLWRPYFKKTFEFDFERLNDLTQWYRMFSQFGINAKRVKRMPELYKHSSNIIPELLPSINDYFKRNWTEPGKFNFKTDAEKVQIIKGIDVI